MSSSEFISAGYRSYLKWGVIALIVGMALSFSSCGPAHTGGFPVIRPAHKLTRDRQATLRAQSYFVKALDYDRRNLDEIALRYYEMAYELDPDESVLRNILVSKYIGLGKNTQALLLIKKNRTTAELPDDDKRLVAKIYLKMGKFDEAAALLEDIPDKTPEEYYSLGMVYEAKGATNKAIQKYLRFLDLKPEAIRIGIKAGGLMIRAGQIERAESLYVKMNQNNPENPDVLTALGVLRRAQGDTIEAHGYFSAAIAVDSMHEEALRNAAQVEINREAYAKAASYYQRLYSQGEIYESVYGKTLAMLHYYNKDYDRAKRLLHNLLKKEVNDFELHFYLGLVANAKENAQLAAMELEKSIALNPEYTDAWRHLIYTHLRTEEKDRALQVAQRFTKSQEEDPAAWRILGSVFNSRQEYERAENALSRAVDLDSTDSQSWFELGSAYERGGKIQKATHAFREVLRLNPGDAGAANYLGYMWAENDLHLDSAQVLLEMALEQDPDNGAYLDSYAWIFYKQGQIDSAYTYITRAVEQLDDDPVIYEHLGDILARKHDNPGAIDAYEKSIELGSDHEDRIRDKIEALGQQLGQGLPQ